MFKKNCKTCDCEFYSTGPAGRYCPTHADEQRKLRAREGTQRHRIKYGLVQKPYVGKGGNPNKGISNPMYKHGMYVFETLRAEIKAQRRYCERCNTDLEEATHYFWVVHHKDHNHWNHDLNNLELLCKRCHQVEHECHLAFTKGATTISKESTLERVEAPTTLQGDDIV